MKSAEKKAATPKEKSASGKKLVQARLPFKVITTTRASTPAAAPPQSPRDELPKKRKLSYTSDENIVENSKKVACLSHAKENKEVVSILSSDEEDLADEGGTGPKLGTSESMNPFVMLKSIDGMVEALRNQHGRVDLSPKTPKEKRKVNGDGTPTDKFLIKMSWSSNKKKRKLNKERKDSCENDSDIEIVGSNPEKKLKIDVKSKSSTKTNEKDVAVESKDESNKKSKSDKNRTKVGNETEKSSKPESVITTNDDEVIPVEDEVISVPVDNKDKTCDKSEKKFSKDEMSDDDVVAIESSLPDSVESKKTSKEDDESEAENLNDSISESQSEKKPTENGDVSNTPSPSKENIDINGDSSNQSYASLAEKEKPSIESEKSTTTDSLSLTPRQIRKKQENEKKQKAREERERKLQEEKQQKIKEKEDKEKQRKREREEKEEQKRKEREEKDEQRRKEKEEKEKKRLAEIEAKNEERRKKEEVKEEERKKKEDEKRKKEQEKEEVENKKKKAAEAFTKFFVPKSVNTKTVGENRLSVDSDIQEMQSNFMPFQIKGDMKLAPLFRKMLDKQRKSELDEILKNGDVVADREKLYLDCLKTGQTLPGKDTRTRLRDDDSSDVVIIDDELKGAGQSIDDENKPVEKFRAKLFLFRENVRPPYYGTWRKKSSVVGPRRPFATDKVLLDYEVDSDEEWEEEEPGESLHGSDDEKESEDEYEVDNEFFVPHGHLSDEEMQDEMDDDDNTPETQKAKLKILQQEFAQEMKKKTEKIKPRLIGTIWADENGNQPSNCSSVIWQSLYKRAMWFSDPIILTEPEPSSNEMASTQKDKQIRPKLTDDLVKDLIHLVHFNRHRKEFMIREFKAHLAEKFKSDPSFPNYTKISIQKKIEKIAKWEMFKDEVRKKNKLCWLVSPETLQKYEIENNGVTNKWKYTLQPKSQCVDVEPLSTEKTELIDRSESNESNCKTKTPAVITKFTKVLSDLEKAKQFKATSPATQKKALIELSTNKTKTTTTTTNGPAITNSNPSTIVLNPAAAAVPKKRVALLMSVPRGQKIPDTTKSDLISRFLKKDETKESKEATTITTKSNKTDPIEAMDVDSPVVVLD